MNTENNIPSNPQIEDRFTLLIEKCAALEEALMISEKKYNIAINFSDLTIFDYDIRSKQMFNHQADLDQYQLPKVLDNAVEALISSGIVLPNSHEDFRSIYQEIEDGAPTSHTVIHALDSNNNVTIIELELVAVYDNNGKPVRAIGVKKDITQTTLLQREKEYGNTLVSNRLLTYEANITKDVILNYNKNWSYDIGLPHITTYSSMIQYISKQVILPEYTDMFNKILSMDNIIASYNSGKHLISFEYKKKQKNNKILWFEQTINIIKDEITNEISVRCYINNINEKKEKELRILEEQKFYETMGIKSAIAFEANITKNLMLSGHQKWETIFNIEITNDYSKMIRTLKEEVIHPEDKDNFMQIFSREHVLASYAIGERELNFEYKRPNELGQYIWMHCTMHLLEVPETHDIKAFAYVENIDKDKQKELKLIYKSEHDLLTGLYNKTTVQELIDAFLNDRYTDLGNHAFFIIDIDYFKNINDNFGHSFGDAILSQVSAKIKDLFRDYDILGRIGGDEFIVFMKNIPSKQIVSSKAQEICDYVKEKYTKNGKEHTISLSIGIAFYGIHGKTYQELYQHSDTALYAAKRGGRDQFSIYDSTMSSTTPIIKEIKQSEFLEAKTFKNGISDFVFRILYKSSDKEASINTVLALIGKHYKISRTYIFEDSLDGLYTKNTFEWCNKEIKPRITDLQNLAYASITNYKDNFYSEGIYYIPDSNKLPISSRNVLVPQNLRSMVQFSIEQNDTIIGFIGFDQYKTNEPFTGEELSELQNISYILGVFIMEMRAIQSNKEVKEMALSIVNGLTTYAYVCNPETHEVLFINKQTLQIVPDAKVGGYCYEEFWNRSSPCLVCPMRGLEGHDDDLYSLDMYNPNLKIWVKATASWINWLKGERVCLVDSMDITKYVVGKDLASEV